MPPGEGADTGCASHVENITGTRKRADFLQVPHTRELDTSLGNTELMK